MFAALRFVLFEDARYSNLILNVAIITGDQWPNKRWDSFFLLFNNDIKGTAKRGNIDIDTLKICFANWKYEFNTNEMVR